MKRSRVAGLVLAAAVTVLGIVAVPAGAFPTTSVTVNDAKGQYSDYVTLSAKIRPAGRQGTVVFTVDGSTDGLVGVAAYDSKSGIASQRYRVPLPEGVYDIEVSFTGTNPGCTAAGVGEITVKAEDAIIKYETEEGCPLPALIPNTSGTTLVRRIVEVPDGSPGDIDKADGSSAAAAAAVIGAMPPTAGPAAPTPDWSTALLNSLLDQTPDGASVAIDVPGLTMRDGRASLAQAPEALGTSQIAGFAVAMSDWLYGYYRGVGSFSCTIYSRETGVRAAAGSVMNSAISAPVAFAFFVEPSSANFSGYAYTQASRTSARALAAAGGLTFTRLSRDRAVFTQTEPDALGNTFTFTQRPSLARGWAPTFAADWDPGMFPEPEYSPEDCPTARFFRGGVDLE